MNENKIQKFFFIIIINEMNQNVTVKTYSKCCSFELSIHQRILVKMCQGFFKNLKQHNSF